MGCPPLVGAAGAATITVTTTSDETAVDGQVSLRGAIASINAAADQTDVTHTGTYGVDDTVIVPAGHYLLGSGQLLISAPVTIQGAGAGSTVIDAQSTSRVFQITGGSAFGTVTFDGLTITGGMTFTNTDVGGGGVLWNALSGNLVLDHTDVVHNEVTQQAGRSRVSPALGGGGIYVDGGPNTGADVTISHSDVSDNVVTLPTSFSFVYSGGGGIFVFNADDVTVSSSTINANSVSQGPLGLSASFPSGGGLNVIFGSTALTNSTVSDNTVSADIGSGGGISDDDFSAPLTVTASTISGNIVNGGGQTSGGILTVAATTVKSSIVAENSANGGPSNCAAPYGSLTSLGYNLEDAANTCNFNVATDIITAYPRLGPLADNGGPTQTQALLAGSPAIDAIPVASCTDQSSPTPQPVSVDQRGFARPDDGESACDIGAYESAFPDRSLSPGNTTCNGTYGGTGRDVTVPAGANCTLEAGARVSHDVTVHEGGALTLQGVSVGHDVQADGATGLRLCASSVANDLHAQAPPGSGDGAGRSVTIGAVTGCAGNAIGRDLVVQNIAGLVVVVDNHVGRDMRVDNNTGGSTVSGNTVGRDAWCQHNNPPAIGTGNNAAQQDHGCPT